MSTYNIGVQYKIGSPPPDGVKDRRKLRSGVFSCKSLHDEDTMPVAKQYVEGIMSLEGRNKTRLQELDYSILSVRPRG